MDDAAGAEEQQCLEEGVGHEVENRRGEGAHAAGEEHVTELADGGISEHPLDVVLNQPNRSRPDGRGRAHRSHDPQRRWREHVERVRARHHINPGGHHGGRVNQGADGGGAFHGVRQPNVERNLRGLPCRADE